MSRKNNISVPWRCAHQCKSFRHCFSWTFVLTRCASGKLGCQRARTASDCQPLSASRAAKIYLWMCCLICSSAPREKKSSAQLCIDLLVPIFVRISKMTHTLKNATPVDSSADKNFVEPLLKRKDISQLRLLGWMWSQVWYHSALKALPSIQKFNLMRGFGLKFKQLHTCKCLFSRFCVCHDCKQINDYFSFFLNWAENKLPRQTMGT